MSIPNRQKFMQVKQKLDYYRLPTSFPPQATSIISKLIQKIEQKQSKFIDKTTQSIRSNPQSSRNYISCQSFLNQNDRTVFILETKIKQLLKQNSLLNKELLQAKQFIELMKQCKYFKQKCDQIQLKSPRSTDPINNQLISLRNGFDILKARQIQLFQELTHVKQKYNQLMQFLHENPNNQKQYIKRLLKYKKLEINADINTKNPTTKNITIPQLEFKTNMDTNKIIAQNYKLQSTNKTLKIKIQNRQIQILRLQSKLIDQFNVNSLIQAFHLEQKNNQIITLKNQIELLLGNSNRIKFNHEQNKNISHTKNIKQNQKNLPKQPQSIKNIKNPPKNPNNVLLIDQKNKQIQKQRKSIRLPESKNDMESFKNQNQSLKQQVKNLKKQIQHLKMKVNFPLKNQVFQQSIQKNNLSDKIPLITKNQVIQTFQPNQKCNKKQQFQRQNENPVKLLKSQIFEKQILIRDMEKRLNQSLQENKKLKERLTPQKSQQIENELQRNNFYHEEFEDINFDKNKEDKQKLLIQEQSSQKMQESFVKNNNLNTISSPIKQIKGSKIEQQFKVDSRSKVVQFENNLIQDENQNFYRPTESKSTNFYSSSLHQKSQKTDLSEKNNQQKINLQQRSKSQINQPYQSNINSRISSSKEQNQNKPELQDIKQQVSQEKSYFSQQMTQQKPYDKNHVSIQDQQMFIKNKSGRVNKQKSFSKINKIEGSGKAVIIIPLKNSKKQISSDKKCQTHNRNKQLIKNEQQQQNINYQTFSNEIVDQSFVSEDSDNIKNQKLKQYINVAQKQKKIYPQEKNKTELEIMKQFEQQQSKYEERIFKLQSKLAQLEQENQQLKYLLNSKNFTSKIQNEEFQQKHIMQEIKIKLKSLQEELQKSMTKIKQKDLKINSQEQQLQLRSLKIIQLNKKITTLQESLTQLKKGSPQSQKQTNIKSYGQKNSNKQNTQTMQLRKNVENLEKQLSKSQQSIIGLNNTLSFMKQQKETTNLQKIKIQKRNDFLKNKLLELQKFIKIQSQQMKRYRNLFGF